MRDCQRRDDQVRDDKPRDDNERHNRVRKSIVGDSQNRCSLSTDIYELRA
jgi:hypothetical protein